MVSKVADVVVRTGQQKAFSRPLCCFCSRFLCFVVSAAVQSITCVFVFQLIIAKYVELVPDFVQERIGV